MFDHRRAANLLATSIDFPLQPQELAALSDHLAACDRCAALGRAVRSDALGLIGLPMVDAPSHIRDGLAWGADNFRPPATRSSRPLVLLAAALVVVAATVGGTIAGTLLTDREPTPLPEAEASAAHATATPAATESASESPAATPAPTQLASPSPSAVPATSTPTVPTEPTVAAVRWPLGLAAMTVTDQLVVRSDPVVSDQSTIYRPSLREGTRLRIVEGPVLGSGYWWYRVDDLSMALDGGIEAGWVASADRDGTPWIGPSPEACEDFPFPAAEVSVGSLAELQVGMRDTWAGCVTTPWTQPYWVTITFREDGTYSAHSLDPSTNVAFYYGTDEDAAAKRYQVNDLQDSLRGVGQIDIVFSATSVNRGELRNIALKGDQLEFEFFHRGDYGPLTYRLYRIGDPR